MPQLYGDIQVHLLPSDAITVREVNADTAAVRVVPGEHSESFSTVNLLVSRDPAQHDSLARVADMLRAAADQLDALDTDRPIPYALTEREAEAASVDATTGAALITAERQRQIDVERRLSAVRDRLDAATPWPWHLFTNRHPTTGGENWGCIETQRHPAGGAGVPLLGGKTYWTGPKQRADADLVAHAPADLAFLADEVERLRAEIDRLQAQAEAVGVDA